MATRNIHANDTILPSTSLLAAAELDIESKVTHEPGPTNVPPKRLSCHPGMTHTLAQTQQRFLVAPT